MDGSRGGEASSHRAIETASRASQTSVKGGELGDGELFGAGVRAEA